MQIEFRHVLFTSSVILTVSCAVLLVILARLASIIGRPRPQVNAGRQNVTTKETTTCLLIVLGSGGHTAEMLRMLFLIPDTVQRFSQRTYVVSSGDQFSALKAQEFEDQLPHSDKQQQQQQAYSIVTVRRARRVHQSFLTTPFSTILSLWDCLQVLRGKSLERHDKVSYRQGIRPIQSPLSSLSSSIPDLILTNGPGTGVCIVIASLILTFFGLSKKPNNNPMRTVFIESWARVKTLSLSGKILRILVNRFLVQWPQLAADGIEYAGPLIS